MCKEENVNVDEMFPCVFHGGSILKVCHSWEELKSACTKENYYKVYSTKECTLVEATGKVQKRLRFDEKMRSIMAVLGLTKYTDECGEYYLDKVLEALK